MLEQYRAVAESEEYKASPAYRLQEYLKQFQRESGYNDVFIPAMQRLGLEMKKTSFGLFQNEDGYESEENYLFIETDRPPI